VHVRRTFCGVMSWPMRSCSPLRMRLAEIVLRSLVRRISSMMTV
jgi:hypothetical protein